VITFAPELDYFRVFGHTSGGGKKALSARDYDWASGNVIVISQSVAEQLYPDGSAIGKKIARGERNELGPPVTVIGVVDDVKRFDYRRPQHMYYVPQRLDTTNLHDVEISIRNASTISGAAFAEAFRKDMPGALQVGNYYFKKMVSYEKIKERTDAMFGQTNDVRMRAYLMAFFLLNILLCVVGTFWYRINSRREETGVRKALGASRASVRNMLLAEGLCLLTAATLPALLIEYQFVRAGLIETLGIDTGMPVTYLPDRTLLRFLITNGLSWLIMAAVTVSAIWLPARRAAAMQPADALHYE
jgi:ABC-type antimicrobial peptide transport system permease subunit